MREQNHRLTIGLSAVYHWLITETASDISSRLLSVENRGTEFRSLSFNVLEKRSSLPAWGEVIHVVVSQVVLVHRQSSRAEGLGSAPDLFLPT